MLRITILLLVVWIQSTTCQNCDKIDWLQPFNNSNAFTCTSSGQYPDETDENCRRYFVCVKNYNSERFITIHLKCPYGTYYNEKKVDCSSDYICPYSSTTAGITATESMVSPKDLSCKYEADPKYFTCKTTGTFPNYNDKNCESYFYCVVVIHPFLIVKTEYFCEKDTYFNPETKSCEANYNCPCNNNSHQVNTSDVTITSTTPKYTVIDYENYQSTNVKNKTSINILSSTSATFLSSTTVNLATTMTEDDWCYYNDDSTDFTCSEKGRFKNYNDKTCQTYFLCSVLRSGRIIQTKYSCPANSLFDPSKSLCDVDYVCPCVTTVTTTTSTTVNDRITDKDDDTSADSSSQNSIEENNNEVAKTTTESLTTTTLDTNTKVTTETQDDKCNYIDDSLYFTCTEKGRFKNYNDKTCQTYFLCSVLRSGLIIQTKYSCPSNSLFDPSKSLCDVDYVCPCATTVTTTSSTTIDDKKTDKDDDTSADSSSQNSSEENNNEAAKTTTESLTTTTLDTNTKITTVTEDNECNYIDNSSYFTCTEKGRFKNYNDKTCQTYFLCSVLSSGRIIQKKFSCPENSLFDPSKSLCDVDYVCPCATTVTTTTSTTIDDRITDKDDDTSADSSSQNSSEENNNEVAKTTTESLTTTTLDTNTKVTTETQDDKCNYIDDSLYFTCTEKGRFKNYNDKTCQTYFLCSVLRSGRIIQTKYSCPANSLFDPSKSLCDVDYVCLCATTVRTTTSTTIDDKKTDKDDDTSADSSSQNSSEENNNEVAKTSTDSLTTTTLDTYTKITTVTQDNECNYIDDSSYFTCTEKGRFKNYNDKTCQTYFLCSVLRSGRIIQTKYSCPANSLFDPSKSLCDVEYVCPCATTVTTTTSTTNDDKKTDKDDDTSAGSSSRNSSEENNNEVAKTTTESLTTTTLDTNTKIIKVTQDNECNYIDNSSYFTCTEKGRFKNYNDKTCQTYFLCSVLRSGRIIQTKYSCPANSLFDPLKSLCDADYVCPCVSDVNDSTSESSIGTTSLATTEINNVDTTSETNRVSTQCSTYNSDPEYFICSAKGRFSNDNDSTCSSYFMCSLLRSGKFIKTKYNCPSNSYFNPSIQLCEEKYKCPCGV